jgi:hypothetical protein
MSLASVGGHRFSAWCVLLSVGEGKLRYSETDGLIFQLPSTKALPHPSCRPVNLANPAKLANPTAVVYG